MEIRFKILAFVLCIQFLGTTQNHFVSVQLDEEVASQFSLDSVYLLKDDTHVLGYDKSGLFNRKIQFDKKIQSVISDFLSESFSYEQNKKGLNVVVDYIQVNFNDQYEVFLTLSFKERIKNNLYHLITVGSYVSGLSHFEVLISEAFQECFDGFFKYYIERDKQLINEKELVKDKINFPILKLFQSKEFNEKGKYHTLADFQQNNIKKCSEIEMISIKEGLNGYLFKIDGKKEKKAIAICDGNDLFYRINKRYYKSFITDTTITILSNDQHKVMDSRLISFYFGIAGGLTSLVLEQPLFFLPGLAVGAIVGHGIANILVKRRMNKIINYRLNLVNGKVIVND